MTNEGVVESMACHIFQLVVPEELDEVAAGHVDRLVRAEYSIRIWTERHPSGRPDLDGRSPMGHYSVQFGISPLAH